MTIKRLTVSLLVLLCLASGALGVGWWRAARAAPELPNAVDIGFAQAMSRHHQQAVLMALRMIDGKPTHLAGFAQGIAYTQQYELGQMRGWLALWNQPLQVAGSGMGWLLMGKAPIEPALQKYLFDCQATPTGMVGLATEAELDQLRRLDGGRERDLLFLKLMMAHHAGALPMARFAAHEGHLIPVREFAQRIELDQAEEMGRMQQMATVLASMPEPGKK